MAEISACPRVFESLEPSLEVVSFSASRTKLLESISDFEIYFASLYVPVDRVILEKASRLRVIVTASTGLDHIDTKLAQARGVTVLSLKGDVEFLRTITSTAEMAWCLLLATVRRLPWAFAAAQSGWWARDEFRGQQLSGKTLGILGYGRLGRIVAEYGNAFRMRVLACNRSPVQTTSHVEMVDYERLLAESDVLSIHVHTSSENRHLINARALAAMKRGTILINTSRGDLLDEVALIEALTNGQLGGAGLDVINGEWLPDLERHPLIAYARTHENLIISPHIAGSTFESQRAVFEYMVDKLKQFLAQFP